MIRSMPSRESDRSASRARAVAVAILSATLLLALAPAIPAHAQVPASRLGWQQRFLGILPLIKPDPKDPVIATVNGAPITLKQVNAYAKIETQIVNATSMAESRAVWRDALDNLVNRQLLIDEAARRGIKIPEVEAAERAREFEIDNASGQEVSSHGAPSPQLLGQVRGSMMIQKMLDADFASHRVSPTAQDIQRYYDQHKDLFVTDPGAVRISHIAVKLPPHATDAQKRAALALIHKYRERAEKTRDFAALAKTISQDSQSAPHGGDLGYFRPGELPPVVANDVIATPVGKLTGIIGSDLGYSFIKVTARSAPTYAPLAKVKQKIAMVLLAYNQDRVVKNLIDKLSKRAKIHINKPPSNSEIQG